MITEQDMIQVRNIINDTICLKLGSSWKDKVTFAFRTDMKRAAGWALIYKNHIDLNQQLFEHNRQEFFNTTIPHECVHLIVSKIYPKAKQAHGPEFKEVMVSIGANPSTYHKMNVSVAINKPMHHYTCACEGR